MHQREHPQNKIPQKKKHFAIRCIKENTPKIKSLKKKKNKKKLWKQVHQREQNKIPQKKKIAIRCIKENKIKSLKKKKTLCHQVHQREQNKIPQKKKKTLCHQVHQREHPHPRGTGSHQAHPGPDSGLPHPRRLHSRRQDGQDSRGCHLFPGRPQAQTEALGLWGEEHALANEGRGGEAK